LQHVERGEHPCALLQDGAVIGFLRGVHGAGEVVDRGGLGRQSFQAPASVARFSRKVASINRQSASLAASAAWMRAARSPLSNSGPDKVTTPLISVWRKVSE
jgi:hypothetical protein